MNIFRPFHRYCLTIIAAMMLLAAEPAGAQYNASIFRPLALGTVSINADLAAKYPALRNALEMGVRGGYQAQARAASFTSERETYYISQVITPAVCGQQPCAVQVHKSSASSGTRFITGPIMQLASVQARSCKANTVEFVFSDNSAIPHQLWRVQGAALQFVGKYADLKSAPACN